MFWKLNTLGNAIFALLFLASAVALVWAATGSQTPWRVNGLAIMAVMMGTMFIVTTTATAIRFATVRR